jgi:type I restriction enzyme S subunit
LAHDWEQRKSKDFLELSLIPGSNGLIAKKLTVKLWAKGVVEKSEVYVGSKNTKYYVRHTGQLMYGKLDFLHQAFGIVPDELDGYESTLDSPAFDVLNGADTQFLLYVFEQPSFYLKQGMKANGSRKAKRIHEETFLNMPIIVPKISEQRAIVEIVSEIEYTIALHQRKFESPKFNLLKGITCFVLFRATQTVLKIVKMYYVWEQRKLGKVSSLSDIDHRMPTSQTTGIPYLMTGNFLPDGGLDFQNAKKISEPDYENLAKKAHPKRGDIIMARYASVGAVRYVETNQRFLVSYSCTIIRPSSIIDGRYLYHALQAGVVQKQIQINKKTGSQANIGMNDLKNLIKLRVAPISEQHKIADIFTSIDKTIALHQRKPNHKNALF